MRAWTIPSVGSRKTRKRKGRGSGSGLGKTAGRGHKGQRARSGARTRPGFEGGQTPLYRRIPKRGFRHLFKKEVQVVNVAQLQQLPETVTYISPKELWHYRMIQDPKGYVKILAQGQLHRGITVAVHFWSEAARQKIEKAGGRCEGIVS